MKFGQKIGNTLIKIGRGLSTSSPVKLKANPLASSASIHQMNALASTYIASGSPAWRNLSTLKYLLECYLQNPVVQAIINIKADAFSNMRFKVKDLKTGEIICLEDYDSDGGALEKLISQPNPLQTTFEWLKQFKVQFEVFGNGYSYASLPVGYETHFTYSDINVINNLPPYYISPVLTGKWLDATTKSEIVKEYKFSGFGSLDRTFPTETILHTNNVNIVFDQNFTEGISELIALKAPISNIDLAYESRNVLIKKRGALGILTSEKKDGVMGTLPLTDDEIEEVQEQYSKYGTLDNQFGLLISPHALNYQKMAMSVKELMLFEEIESDAIAIANAFGVPELLAKYYLKGGTFENLDASEKRLYDSTIIPESKDFMVSLNNFLKTREHGIELLGSFEHLNVLQSDKKEESETTKNKEASALSAFKIGAIDYNTYLAALGLPNDDSIGSLRVWDLTPEQLQAIGIINNIPVKNDGKE